MFRNIPLAAIACLPFLPLAPPVVAEPITGIFGTGFGGDFVYRYNIDGSSEEYFPGRGGLVVSNGEWIFTANPTGIFRTSIATRETETLASFTGNFVPKAITTDGYRLYIALYQQKELRKYALDGSPLGTVCPTTTLVTALTTDGLHLYWSDEELGIYRTDMNGVGAERIYEGRNVFGLTNDTRRLYWTNDKSETIHRSLMDGTGEETIVDLAAHFGGFLPNGYRVNYFPVGIRATGDYLYWLERGNYKGIYRCEPDGANPVRLIASDLVSYDIEIIPNALFPEAVEPIVPTIRHDAANHTVRLDWPSLADRRYRVFQSEDLENFSPAGGSVVSSAATSTALLPAPGERGFYLVRKLPGFVLPQ